MHSNVFVAALAALPFAFAAPSRLPEHYFRRGLNDTQNNTTPEAGPVPISTCDLSAVVQPSNTLTPPGSDLQLMLVAHGEGTQNYTCGANLTAAPSSIGAVAQLWDASCAIANNPGAPKKAFGSIAESATIGTHFFVDNTTPDFDIIGLGNTQTKKAEEVLAPQPASDIKWLRLVAQAAGSNSSVKQIYRLNTVGGLAPSTCEGRAVGEVMTVEYEAQYWIYADAAAPRTLTTEVPSASESQKPEAAQFTGAASQRMPLNLWTVVVSLSMFVFFL